MALSEPSHKMPLTNNTSEDEARSENSKISHSRNNQCTLLKEQCQQLQREEEKGVGQEEKVMTESETE